MSGINAQVSSTGATVTYPTGAVVYTFLSGGTITFSATITFDLLIVGGGGGGGISQGGGGGGGGIVYATGVSRTAGSYSISVATWRAPGGTGHSSSAFDGYAFGGGAGGSGIGNSGGSGGNGGGGCGGGAGGTADSIGILPSAPYTTAQLIGGQIGGTVAQGSYSGGKGGGGYSSAITGTSVLYANGGGGYTGWSMGSSNAPYTGGGGGGGSGGDIGSEGIVVIRILIPTSCPFGQYIGAVSCLPCTNGGVGATYTGSGTTSTNCPVSCLAGYYSVNSANCGPCTNAGVGGNYTGVGTNSTNCPVSCFAGYVQMGFSCLVPVNSTGATITYPTGATVYSFTDSGSITFAVTTTVDLLIVGGGGGGGGFTEGGGGGGGGSVYARGISIPAGAYAVVVGGGGQKSIPPEYLNSNGNPSSVFGASAYGGGGGAGAAFNPGRSGANGGGGTNSGDYWANRWETNPGGSAGTIGILPTFPSTKAQLIGGRAGQTPPARPFPYLSGGYGGGGFTSDITGASLSYANGGGGGIAGTSGVSNAALPGGGGGGGDAAGPGGSGIVVIRINLPTQTSCPSGQYYGVDGTCVGFYRTTINLPPTTLPSDPGGNMLISDVLSVTGNTYQATLTDVYIAFGIYYQVRGGGLGPGSFIFTAQNWNAGQYYGSAGLVVDGSTVSGWVVQLHMSYPEKISSLSYKGTGCGGVLAGSVDGSTWTRVNTTAGTRDCNLAVNQVIFVLNNTASFAHLALIVPSDCNCGLGYVVYYDLTFQAFDGGVAECAKTCATGMVTHCDPMGNTVCCDPGYTFLGGVSTACEACAVGKYSSNGTTCAPCTNAGVGRIYTGFGTNSTNCPLLPTSCPSGQYIGTISCQPCTYGGVGAIYTGFGTNSTNCPVRCSAGYYQVAFSCLSCPIGKFSLANQTGASSCQACTNAGVGGSYTGFGTTSTNCPVSCFAGYYQAALSCLSCPIGTFSLATSTDCSACTNLGVGRTFASFGTTSTNCLTVCAAGYYAVGANCSQCAVGRYSGANSTNCSVCTNTLAAGSVFTTAGTNSTNCLVGCAAGYAYGTASSACMRCSAGEFLYNVIICSARDAPVAVAVWHMFDKWSGCTYGPPAVYQLYIIQYANLPQYNRRMVPVCLVP